MVAQDALLLLPYGVYVVTTGGESRPPGAFTACWVMQVSFEPLLVALAVDKTSRSQALLEENGLFAVNILGKDQTSLAARLGTPSRISPYKFNGVAWHAGATGAPLLDTALAHLECQVTSSLDPGGDHLLLIGAVVAGGVQRREAVLMLEESGLRYR
jgi:flavin reductase (DIM6/NTAB) family NADH-FMN oxidoreductase RutF